MFIYYKNYFYLIIYFILKYIFVIVHNNKLIMLLKILYNKLESCSAFNVFNILMRSD